jgi:uncharacterized membrane protein YdfJ with MMPL/SSD domain
LKRAGIGAWIALLVVGLVVALQGGFPSSVAAPDGGPAAAQQKSRHRDGTQLTTNGVVVRVLADDRDGSRINASLSG